MEGGRVADIGSGGLTTSFRVRLRQGYGRTPAGRNQRLAEKRESGRLTRVGPVCITAARFEDLTVPEIAS
jgi:hypothetical protein